MITENDVLDAIKPIIDQTTNSTVFCGVFISAELDGWRVGIHKSQLTLEQAIAEVLRQIEDKHK